MKNKAELGKEGEKIAADYLKARGYKLLETNWRFKRSEIDLICRKDDLLVLSRLRPGHP